MAAPNAQPAKRGSMKGPHTHAPHEAGTPAASQDNTTKVTPGHTKGQNPGKVGGRRGNGKLK